MKNKDISLGGSPINQLLWYYSIPTIIGTLVNALYNIVDRIYIGQGVGALAISGMALTFPIMNILGAFGMLVGQGCATYTSLLLGRGERKRANLILSNGLFLTILIYFFTCISSLPFLDEILLLFGGTDATIPYAKQYLQILIPGNILLNLSYSFNNIIRASGHPIRAMLSMLIGAVTNVILDPIFIFGFGLGIQGAAIATLISMAASATWVMSFFTDRGKELHFDKEAVRIDLKLCLNCLAIGLAPFLLNICASLTNVLMNHALLRYGGDLAIGAFGIITSFTTLLVMAIIGIAQGLQPIVGYNYGARQYHRVRQALTRCCIIATALTTFGCVLGILCPDLIARVFTHDEPLIEIIRRALPIYISMFFVVGFHIIVTNYFQSIGRAKISIFLSLSRQIVILVPFILIYPPIFGLNGAWMAQPTSNILSAAIAGIILFSHLKRIKLKEKAEGKQS